MQIEPATVDDVQDVLDRWVALAREQRAFGSHVLPAESEEAMADILGHDTLAGNVLVARDGDDVAGFVAVGVDTGALTLDETRGVVRYLWVDEEYRNEGVGTDLVAAAENLLADRGVDVVGIDAMVDNEAAQRLYRRLGYEDHRVELEKRIASESDKVVKGDR